MKLFDRSHHSKDAVPPGVIAVRVTDAGYEPDTIELPAGQPARLAFTRMTSSPCSAEVNFPDLGVTAKLPVGEQILVDLPAAAAGEHAFECSMGMLHGRLIASEAPGGCPTVVDDTRSTTQGAPR